MSRALESLSPREVLAVAVQVEVANAERFRTFANLFRGYDDRVSQRFRELAAEEDGHRRILEDRYRSLFEDEIPVIEEVEVQGVIESVDLDDAEHMIFDTLAPDQVYELALRAELGAQEFYRRAAGATADDRTRDLFRELAEMEDSHASWLQDRIRETGGREAS